MDQPTFNRRAALATAAMASAATLGIPHAFASQFVVTAEKENTSPFRFCLNTSTIREQKLPLDEQVDLAIECGYDGIEPWMRDVHAYEKQGGNIEQLAKRAAEQDLRIESAIGFASWIVDDKVKRKAGLDSARKDMGILARLGGRRIAAPPVGATREAGLDLHAAAARYHELLDVGREMGVVPQLELWGFSKNLSRLGELAFVAAEADHPDACVLPDVYHIYKGGSGFAGLRMFNGRQIHVFHVNDYPADPPRDTISDADRVYPGDGVAPLGSILRTLRDIGFRGALSLELFNRTYWKQDAKLVAATGLSKMKTAVAVALAPE
jgi:sugar phosphate isomerase/epimerase